MAFDIATLAPAALNLVGGLFGAQQQNSNAAAARDATVQAAQIAADASRFRPIGMTNTYGTSQFQTDASGNVTGAGYAANPYLSAIQQRLLQAAPGNLIAGEQQQNAAGGLFNLGSQYLATSPEQAASTWMQQQQALQRPSQDQAYAQIQNNLVNKGRQGLSIAQGGDLAAANPEMAAYYNAKMQNDRALAAQADQYGQQRTQFGAGLFGTGNALASSAYAPLTANLQAGNAVDAMGRSAFDTGVTLGGRVTAGAQTAANALQSGMNTAAQYNTQFTNPLSSLIAGSTANTSTAVPAWFTNLIGGKA